MFFIFLHNHIFDYVFTLQKVTCIRSKNKFLLHPGIYKTFSFMELPPDLVIREKDNLFCGITVISK